MEGLRNNKNSFKLSNPTELASIIPGWGSDLDPHNRPAVPKEKIPPNGTGAHWIEPEQQVPRIKIHKSPEHLDLTATFGTSCPPKGLSGKLRDFAYKFSEGRNAHWMTLLFADRINVIEGRISDLLHGRLFNPLKESGVLSEWKKHGLRARVDHNRADTKRVQNEILLVAGAAIAVWVLIRMIKD